MCYKVLWRTSTSAATVHNESCGSSSSSCFFRNPFSSMICGFHFHPYWQAILVIDSLRASAVLLVELNVFCCNYCEKIFPLQLFCTFKAPYYVLNTFSIRISISWHILIFALWNVYRSSVGSFFYCCYYFSNKLFYVLKELRDFYEH